MDCKNIIHPFQTDEGTSQRQRLNENLLSGPSKIDGRSFADLLDFFAQLSRRVNYYNENLERSDWQPFFRKSLPFTLAAIIKYDRTSTEKKLALYKKRFLRKPSPAGLQLLLNYTFNGIIKKIDGWQKAVIDSALPFETVLDKLIRDKLNTPVKEFIRLSNTGKQWFCTRNFNFRELAKNPVWMLEPRQLVETDIMVFNGNNTKRKRLTAIYQKLGQLIQSFLDVFRLLATSAEMSMAQSLQPLKEELKEKHPPHLAILFAFLKLFEYLQSDLNGFSKKHLDFFYNNILLLKPKQATPDKLHVVFEIQKQLSTYMLKKGLLLKDGKDKNKEEIYFATGDEIVVNKTQVADQRTLFLNNLEIKHQLTAPVFCADRTVVEGVYAAADATKANGVDKDFTDGLPARATLGDKWSKYADPEKKFIYPYPNARIGFILASPVLLLTEGTRTVTITLKCRLEEDYCKSLMPGAGVSNPCCDTNPGKPPNPGQRAAGPASLEAGTLFAKVSDALKGTYYYINREVIALAAKNGIGKELENKLTRLLAIRHVREVQNPPSDKDTIDKNLCYCPREEILYEITIPDTDPSHNGFEDIFSVAEREILHDFFKPRTALNVLFSGEKDWIAPKREAPNKSQYLDIAMSSLSGNLFTLTIKAILTPDQPAVSFYNLGVLKEDLHTSLPLVKLELDDKIKLEVPVNDCKGAKTGCCEREVKELMQEVSLYHFFRNVKLLQATNIDVKVCGLKNVIVQNDENVENVNSLIRPFGSRPLAGANFYVGSQEIFSKNWQQIWVNAVWKDKPDLATNYKFYNYGAFEDGSMAITEASFRVTHAVLENGNWKTENPPPVLLPYPRRLFNDPNTTAAPGPICGHSNAVPGDADNIDHYHFLRSNFINSKYERKGVYNQPLAPLHVSSDYGFLRLTLEGVGFQHERYAFVVARHMMVLANLIDPIAIPQMIIAVTEAKDIIAEILNKINSLSANLTGIQAGTSSARSLIGIPFPATDLYLKLDNLIALLVGTPPASVITGIHNDLTNIKTTVLGPLITAITNIENEKNTIFNVLFTDPGSPPPFVKANYPQFCLHTLLLELQTRILFLELEIKGNPDLKDGLPKEPYTPAIKDFSLDYEAIADDTDIELIHLYPFAGTYKKESLPKEPMLLPTFCDEGNFFIGLKDLVPGTNVSILFQLAEATADSESEREELSWYYLENNTWKLLRTGFEVLDDDTNGLTTSGIIKFLMPGNMTSENSVMPGGLHWIKAAIPRKSKSVSEITGIHTQAVKAVFTNEAANDRSRLGTPLAAGAVSKLKEADANVKKISQPYDSFGGRVPEADGHFYIRASELLHHKNRAIQKFDYERLILEAFPQVYKLKCINHSYALDAHKYINDFPIAPGYVLLAVIPDLNLLKAAKSFEPKAPVSLLEEITAFLQKKCSPFVRLWVKNPRYEKVNFCLRVKLVAGKDEMYYQEKLKQDTREFLAPWAIGEFDKLSFGQPVSRSEMIRFLESRDYIDYISDLRMIHDDAGGDIKSSAAEKQEIVPVTPRSILVAGSIDVCIDGAACETWCFCKDNTGKPCCEHEPVPVNEYNK